MPKAATKPQVASKPKKTKPPKETKPVGRPPRWETPKALGKDIQAYLADCAPHRDKILRSYRKDYKTHIVEEEEITPQRPITITGFCVFAGITRETLNDYETDKGKEGFAEFSDTIKRFKIVVENYAEEVLMRGKVHPAGIIFNLKNNFGWVDKTEQDITSGGKALNAGKPSDEAMALLQKALGHGNSK